MRLADPPGAVDISAPFSPQDRIDNQSRRDDFFLRNRPMSIATGFGAWNDCAVVFHFQMLVEGHAASKILISSNTFFFFSLPLHLVSVLLA